MFVEEARRRLDEVAQRAGVPFQADKPLSDAAVVWLDRMRVALCNTEVSTEAIAEMDAAMRQALPARPTSSFVVAAGSRPVETASAGRQAPG